MKIGVYGGTFNPPHLGHLTAARTVYELLGLDLLLLIPAGLPPHKKLPAESPTPEQRLEMTRLAGEQLGLGDRVRTLDIELERGGRSFTSDTLAQLKAQYPDSELWLARKRNAVDLMETSSLRFFAELEDAGETFADRKLDPNEYAAGGGFPIRLRGTGVIGSICVSGYPDHVDDHQLIINTLAEYFA